MKPDMRPAVVLDQVKDVLLERVTAPVGAASRKVVMRKVENVGCAGLAAVDVQGSARTGREIR
jgi:hypothetical protein